MALVFTDVGAAAKDMPEARPDPIGVVLLDPFGNWEVARRDGHKLSGNGPIVGLKRNGTWLSNLSFDETRSVFNSDEHKQIVRGGSWLLYGMDDVLNEWGYSNLDLKQRASFMSTITGRMFDILETMLVARGTRNPEKKLKEICRSASLATGLMSLMESNVKKTIPSDDKMRDHFERCYQNGMPHRNDVENESEMILDFRFPRFSYAAKLASVRVPLDSEWQRANKPDELSQEDFVREVTALGRSAIFRAVFDYDPELHPRWMGDMIGHKSGTERTRFLLNEIVGAGEMDKRIESALISKGKDNPSVVSGMLADISKAFGGDNAARLSWTAGLMAENIIAAPHRAGRVQNAAVSAEQIWLAAEDRMMMAPLMRALTEAGCIVHNARGGRVSVITPRVPEVMLAATELAWDHGAHLPLGQALNLNRAYNIDLPTERSAFIGSDADYLVAAAHHKGDRKTLWGLDTICDAKSAEERSAMSKSVLS